MTGHGSVSLMGVVNLTPDSFSASSRVEGAGAGDSFLPDVGDALRRIEKHLRDGADIIDIGACSTRPGGGAVPEYLEWSRLEGVLKVFRREFGHVSLSIDTFRAGIAGKAAQAAGNIIINDVGGCQMDAMLQLAAARGLTYVATHGAGDSSAAGEYPEGVTAAVRRFFEQFALRAAGAGLKEWILDPGLGFSKTAGQCWDLLGHLTHLADFGRPILIGYSRKRMIYEPLGLSLADVEAGLAGYRRSLFGAQSRRAFETAVEQGASIIRLHDISEVTAFY